MTRSMLTRLVLVGSLAVGAGTTAVAVPFLASAASTGYEAESATISQGTVATNHPGFTGTGFVDYSNVAGSYVEFSVPAAQAGTEEAVLYNRQAINLAMHGRLDEAIAHRHTPGDVGVGNKTEAELHRADISEVVMAAGKRLGEALRWRS